MAPVTASRRLCESVARNSNVTAYGLDPTLIMDLIALLLPMAFRLCDDSSDLKRMRMTVRGAYRPGRGYSPAIFNHVHNQLAYLYITRYRKFGSLRQGLKPITTAFLDQLRICSDAEASNVYAEQSAAQTESPHETFASVAPASYDDYITFASLCKFG